MAAITIPTSLSVQILDEGGSSRQQPQLHLHRHRCPPERDECSPPSATEGVALAGITVATFHDTALGSDATDFTATVSWGSSTSSSGSVVYEGSRKLRGAGLAHLCGRDHQSHYPVGTGPRRWKLLPLSGSHAISVADAPLTT